MTAFPHWLVEAIVTGTNVDGERLAVGLKGSEMWLCRLSKFSNEWCSVRQAYPSEIIEYDRMFLLRYRIGGADERSGPGQLYLHS